jgi:hypothetical protein
MVQFFVVETGFAESITARSDKQDDRAKTLLAFGRAKKLHELDCFISQQQPSLECDGLPSLCH